MPEQELSKNASKDQTEEPLCPVCKMPISQDICCPE